LNVPSFPRNAIFCLFVCENIFYAVSDGSTLTSPRLLRKIGRLTWFSAEGSPVLVFVCLFVRIYFTRFLMVPH
jgi:hypothetical protein